MGFGKTSARSCTIYASLLAIITLSSPAESAVTYREVSQKIFGPVCIDCHVTPDPPAGLDLQSYEGLMKSKVVVPGKPEESLLMKKLESGEMPLAGLPLEESELALVREWIINGALDAAPVAGIALKSVSPRYGPSTGRFKVTVTGEHLTQVKEVLFDGVACAPISAVTEGSLDCIVPAVASPKFVTVTLVSDADKASVDSAFEYRLALGPTYEALRINVFGPRCIECHSNKPGKPAPKGLDLTTLELALSHRRAIVPGDLKKSRLYKKVREGEMPRNGPPLGPEEVRTIAVWIQRGAPP